MTLDLLQNRCQQHPRISASQRWCAQSICCCSVLTHSMAAPAGMPHCFTTNYMTTQQPFLFLEEFILASPLAMLLPPPCGSSVRSSSGLLCKSFRVLSTSFMAGRFSGVIAQQVSTRVRREDGHWGGMGRLYPFATCARHLLSQTDRRTGKRTDIETCRLSDRLAHSWQLLPWLTRKRFKCPQQP